MADDEVVDFEELTATLESQSYSPLVINVDYLDLVDHLNGDHIAALQIITNLKDALS